VAAAAAVQERRGAAPSALAQAAAAAVVGTVPREGAAVAWPPPASAVFDPARNAIAACVLADYAAPSALPWLRERAAELRRWALLVPAGAGVGVGAGPGGGALGLGAGERAYLREGAYGAAPLPPGSWESAHLVWLTAALCRQIALLSAPRAPAAAEGEGGAGLQALAPPPPPPPPHWNWLRRLADVRVLGVLAGVALLLRVLGVAPTAALLVAAYAIVRIAVEKETREAAIGYTKALAAVIAVLAVAYHANAGYAAALVFAWFWWRRK
jgi:hypothetical protein